MSIAPGVRPVWLMLSRTRSLYCFGDVEGGVGDVGGNIEVDACGSAADCCGDAVVPEGAVLTAGIPEVLQGGTQPGQEAVDGGL